MPQPRKTWQEKLNDDKDLPKRIELTGAAAKKWGDGVMVVPRPRDVAALMQQVRKGKLTTINELRAAVARQYQVDCGCPITTGIFSWIAAHAAEEAADAGAKRIIPYWRTLKGTGELNPKYPGGIEAQRSRLEAEGHTVVSKGKKFVVADYSKHLAALTPAS